MTDPATITGDDAILRPDTYAILIYTACLEQEKRKHQFKNANRKFEED